MMDFSSMRAFFDAGNTLDVSARLGWLRALQQGMLRREAELLAALELDLGKAPMEGYMTEVGLVLDELRCQIHNLRRWAKPRRVRTPLAQFHAVSRIYREPYGLVLVMAPWNYPLQLSLEPLIGAIAAGNCVVLKPSNYAPHTAKAMERLLSDCLPRELVRVVQGGRAENAALLDTRFDYIFFTGGKTVGRLVMEKAAKHLTPVSLELGGKSPVLVLDDANLDLAAKRIIFGKLLNSGQTCVAPDYVLVQRGAKDALVAAMRKYIALFLGEHPLRSPEYPHIVNEKHVQRLNGLLKDAAILSGGQTDGLRIEPTLIEVRDRTAPAMQEEIFGPILPILTMDTLEDMITFVRVDEKPLALYLFTESKAAQREVLRRVSFGGGCVNDTVVHLATTHMGFGGVGASGMGAYHGKRSFDTFSHEKSVLDKSTFLDLPIRYHPYTQKKEKLIRFFLK
ncbi:MAG: aldehyde dehydrogenase [Candidatus Spyradocola sp.]